MRISNLILLAACLCMTPLLHAQDYNNENICINQNELKLFNLINQFRLENDKGPIPLSRSLTYVAQLHLDDLIREHPDTSICNMHSWSVGNQWVGCCYNEFLPKPECMWLKPQELTDYDGKGYELAYWDTYLAEPDSIIYLWQDIPASFEMIVNQGAYAHSEWKAMGLAVSEQYALVWFGEYTDNTGRVLLCGSGLEIQTTGDVGQEVSIANNKDLMLKKTGMYHIIFGSFTSLPEAEATVRRYRGDEFPDSGIIRGDRNFRISLRSYNTLQEARNSRSQLGDGYANAWILKY